MLKYSGCRFLTVQKRGVEEDKGVKLKEAAPRKD
jgi:hypothetical protein